MSVVCLIHHPSVFTARCIVVQSAVLRLHVVHPSVRLPVFEKTRATSQKSKKSCFFGFSKKRKKRKKRNHLAMQPLISQLPEVKSVPVSHGHQHQTSCSEVWTQETMQLRTVCDKCL